MSRKTTASDVARAAGVSPATVDRVLNNRGGVAAEKEKRVLDCARRLGLDRALDQRAARTLRIPVLIQPPSNPFHAAVQAEFECANRSRRNFNMQFRIFHIEPTAPRRTAELVDRLAPTSDGLVICCGHDEDIASALAAFSARGHPVVMLGTGIRGSGAWTYVGPDNRKAGRVAGDLMGRLIGMGGGEVMIIAGMLSMIGHEEREMGFRSVLRERYPHCRGLDVLQSFEQGERAGELVYQALRRNPAIRGIYNVSAGAQPIVDVLSALGRHGEIVFITHELTEARRRLLRAGKIDVIIDQNPELEVRTVLETLASHYRRLETSPPPNVTPVMIHMIENA